MWIRPISRQLDELVVLHRGAHVEGEVASYIPELKKGNPALAGIPCGGPDGLVAAGDTQVPLSLQSISKIITLMVVLADRGEAEVFSRVGSEPTGGSIQQHCQTGDSGVQAAKSYDQRGCYCSLRPVGRQDCGGTILPGSPASWQESSIEKSSSMSGCMNRRKPQATATGPWHIFSKIQECWRVM